MLYPRQPYNRRQCHVGRPLCGGRQGGRQVDCLVHVPCGERLGSGRLPGSPALGHDSSVRGVYNGEMLEKADGWIIDRNAMVQGVLRCPGPGQSCMCGLEGEVMAPEIFLAQGKSESRTDAL